MKKPTLHGALYTLSALFLLGFCGFLAVDWCRYDTTLNSAPFYVFALARGVELLLPGAILLLAAGIAKELRNDRGKQYL